MIVLGESEEQRESSLHRGELVTRGELGELVRGELVRGELVRGELVTRGEPVTKGVKGVKRT